MKKAIAVICFVCLTMASMPLIAQHPKEIPQETVEMQKARTNKGGAVAFFEWNIDHNEIFENKYFGGISRSCGIGYGYFLFDRCFLSIKGGLYSFANRGLAESLFSRDYHMELCARGYFFKKAQAFVEIGARCGAYKETNNTMVNTNALYVAPMASIGYEYLVTSLHPMLNNRLGVAVQISTLVPVKRNMTEEHLPYFPQVELKFGVYYHFTTRIK